MEKQPHIQLSNDIQVKKAIIVGDPARVEVAASLLIKPENLVFNREYKSLVGMFNSQQILVISTGIGAPSTGIAIEELHAIGVKEIIRVGSCGAMNSELKVGEIMVGTGVVRDEGLTKNYIPLAFPAVPSVALLQAALSQTKIPVKSGIIRSHDGFYMDNNEEVEEFWANQCLGADMESSTLYVLGAIRKIKALSILTNVVPFKGSLAEGVNDLVSGDEAIKFGEIQALQLAMSLLAGEGE